MFLKRKHPQNSLLFIVNILLICQMSHACQHKVTPLKFPTIPHIFLFSNVPYTFFMCSSFEEKSFLKQIKKFHTIERNFTYKK